MHSIYSCLKSKDWGLLTLDPINKDTPVELYLIYN